MADAPEIIIPLSLETTAFVDQLAEAQQAADEAFSRGISTAIDKAQRKVDDLTAAQTRLNAVIEQNTVVITELESRRSLADSAEQARIDQQVAALTKLSQQHAVEQQTMEAKKVQVGANALAMVAANDAERQAIMQGVQAQLISIQTLKDQDIAYNRVRDSGVAAQRVIQQQLEEVIAKQGEVQSSIVQQTEAYERLAAARGTQPQSQQAQTEAEMAAIGRVLAARENENLVLDAKRVRLESDAAAASATGDAERAGVRQSTEERLRQLAVELDQQRVRQGVRDTWSAADERQRAALAAITADEQRLTEVIQQQQAVVSQMRSDRPNQPDGQQATTDSELAARQKIIDQHIQELALVQQKRVALEAEAAVAAATSDQERANIQAAAEAEQRTIQLQADEQRAISRTRDTRAEAATQAAQQAAELASREARNNVVIEATTARIKELQVARSTASAEERTGVDNEIEALQRSVVARERDNEKLAEKRVLLGETTALAQATSQEEREAIQQVTAARLSELSVQRDQSAAQRQVTAEVEAGISIVGSFVSMFSGLGGAMLALQAIKQVLQEDMQIMQGIVAAGKTLREQAGQQYDVSKGFNAEMGLFDAKGEAQGTAALNAIAQTYTLPQAVVGETGSALAATLRRAGVSDVGSDQFRSLVGNAALYANKGIEPSNLSYFVQDRLRDNPGLTGRDLNQELGDVLRDANGSPKLANEGLSILSQDAERFRTAGFTARDQLQLFRRAAQVAPAAEVPGLLRQYGQGLDRLLGLRPRDMLELAEKVNDISPQQEKVIKEMSSALPDDKLGPVLRQIEAMRKSGTGMPALDAVFEQGLSAGHIDIPAFDRTVSGLDANARQVIARQVAGPRNVVALGSLLDYRAGRPAVRAPLMPNPDSPAERTRVATEQADYQASLRAQPVAEEATFSEELDRETTYVERHKDQLLDFYQRHPGFGHSLGMDFTSSIADQREIAAARVLTRRLVELGRLRQQMVEGKAQFTPQQSDALQSGLDGMLKLLSPNGEQNDAIKALANGAASTTDMTTGVTRTTTAAQALSAYDADPEGFVRQNLNTNVISTTDDQLTDDRRAGAVIRAANAAAQAIRQQPAPQVQGPARPAAQPATRPTSVQYREPTTDADLMGPPAPTTRPTAQPVSINYHVRQTNYGYSSDALGAPAQFDSNYG